MGVCVFKEINLHRHFLSEVILEIVLLSVCVCVCARNTP